MYCNSIIYDLFIKDSNNFYLSQLAKKLGNRYDVRHFGVSGATLPKQGDIPHWKRIKPLLTQLLLILTQSL